VTETKSQEEYDFLMWFYSYRGSRQTYLIQHDAPQTQCPWFLDANDMARKDRDKKREQMFADLVQQKTCTIDCYWEDPNFSQMILTLV
jgi:hypothetical protein